ncbi:MAG: acyl-CoA synthetase [Bacteroidetes bacterium]|nr:acyl-CoA synthetase [Bacteroidota bacterium]
MLPIFTQAQRHPHSTAILDSSGEYTYESLSNRSSQIAVHLLQGQADLNEQRVAFMVSPGFNYAATLWGIWKAGGIAVPLCLSYPLPALAYVIEDTKAAFLVIEGIYQEMLQPYALEKGIPLVDVNQVQQEIEAAPLPQVNAERGALILYTSGTTSLPKGVLSTHANLEAQISTLIDAWEWTSSDHTLCLLPLHHVHGLVNVTCCALWAGATLQFLHPFLAGEVFSIFLNGKINVFMAVPTIYFKLIAEFDSYSENKKKTLKDCMSAFRLMVSGSAALPASVMERWQEVSGHTLLERYGMTEIGMAISNPYRGERRTGFIGSPLPGVQVRLVDEASQEVAIGTPGEIQVKGPAIFSTYWGKPEATKKAFTEGGWFKTGDIAVIEQGYYRILGRDSIDIIKSGGYKISALEIEEVLRSHSSVKDCAVVGIADPEWGERVVAVLVASDELDLESLKLWIRGVLPTYKTPQGYLILPELPRNGLGKVVKNELKPLFS